MIFVIDKEPGAWTPRINTEAARLHASASVAPLEAVAARLIRFIGTRCMEQTVPNVGRNADIRVADLSIHHEE